MIRKCQNTDMARTKEFDRDATLLQSISVFSQHGYEGTSTEVLLKTMGISRQSLYDTYGDKWRLYLESLQRYVSDSVGAHLVTLEHAAGGRAAIEAFLIRAVNQARADASPACLGVSAVCEFGRSAPEVVALTEAAGRLLVDALKRRLREAASRAEMAPDIDIDDAAAFLASTLTGIKVAARAGASQDSLLGIARMALRSLR
jgi:TetR/AcrR family transcriptional repressor of nem operon